MIGSRLLARRLNAAIARTTRGSGSTTTAPPSSPSSLSGGMVETVQRAGLAVRSGAGGGRGGEGRRRQVRILADAEAVLPAVGSEERVLEPRRVLPEGGALRPSRGHRAGERVARFVQVGRRRGAGLGARAGGRARHQQLQLAGRRQVVDRAAQVADPAGAQHRLLDLQDAARVVAVGVQVDRREHPAVGAADREGDVDRAEQLVPVAHFARIVRLAEAHQRQLGEDDVMRQRLAHQLVDAALVGGEHRPRGQGPFGGQRGDPSRATRQPMTRKAGRCRAAISPLPR